MTAIMFVALVWQVIDFLRELAAIRENRNAVIVQASAWVGGFILVVIGAHAAVTAKLVLPGSDLPLGVLDWGSQILVGMMVASLASSAVDIKQAIDNTDSARKPAVLPPAPPGS